VSEIQRLIESFGKIPPDLRRELRPAVRQAAQVVMEDAQRRASWSSRIPGAMRVSVRLSGRGAGASVVVSAAKAPHGRPYEHLGQPGTFRHPVFWPRSRHMVFGVERPGAFKHGRWVSQAARPYLFPAAEARADAAAKEIDQAVQRVMLRHGWS
jgi:hypothetical protein